MVLILLRLLKKSRDLEISHKTLRQLAALRLKDQIGLMLLQKKSIY